MKKHLLWLLIVATSCNAPILISRPDARIQTLGIYFDTGPDAMPVVSDLFQRVVDDFILKYNTESGHALRLRRATANDSCAVRIKLVATRLVTPNQQAGAVVGNILGLSLPILLASSEAPVIFFFYFVPDTKSLTELSLTDDINGMQPAVRPFVVSTPGFLRSPEKQINRHPGGFALLLRKLVLDIEKQMKMKKGMGT